MKKLLHLPLHYVSVIPAVFQRQSRFCRKHLLRQLQQTRPIKIKNRPKTQDAHLITVDASMVDWTSFTAEVGVVIAVLCRHDAAETCSISTRTQPASRCIIGRLCSTQRTRSAALLTLMINWTVEVGVSRAPLSSVTVFTTYTYAKHLLNLSHLLTAHHPCRMWQLVGSKIVSYCFFYMLNILRTAQCAYDTCVLVCPTGMKIPQENGNSMRLGQKYTDHGNMNGNGKEHATEWEWLLFPWELIPLTMLYCRIWRYGFFNTMFILTSP